MSRQISKLYQRQSPIPLHLYSGYSQTDNKAYCDYWDHALLLNDALWDDYFVSSLADQTRPGASARCQSC